jgi:hypothetical protein
MRYPDCIFCGGTTKNSPIEHIFPESLGGNEGICMKRGLVCGKCNQYFGSKIENFVLNSYPFLHYRFTSHIVTKRRKYPRIITHLGDLISSPFEDIIGIDPSNEDIHRKIQDGSISQVTILAEIVEPKAICRFLLKMGLEIIADDRPLEIYNSKYDVARIIARAPKRGDKWWFIFIRDEGFLFSKQKPKNNCDIELSTSVIEEHEFFHLKLGDISFITPIEQGFIPDPEITKIDKHYLYEIVF